MMRCEKCGAARLAGNACASCGAPAPKVSTVTWIGVLVQALGLLLMISTIVVVTVLGDKKVPRGTMGLGAGIGLALQHVYPRPWNAQRIAWLVFAALLIGMSTLQLLGLLRLGRM